MVKTSTNVKKLGAKKMQKVDGENILMTKL
jgi:hypothetical protein